AEARGAEAALKGVALDERLLERVQAIASGKPLDRGHRRAGLHGGQGEARIDPPTIDQHGAGPTLAVVATFLGASQTQVFPQGIEQRHPRLKLQLVSMPIDLQGDRYRQAAVAGRALTTLLI